MMADAWVDKGGENKHIVHGFGSVHLADPNIVMHQRFQARVLSACGSAEVCAHCLLLVAHRTKSWNHYLVHRELASLDFHLTQEPGNALTITPDYHVSS